MIVDSRWWRFIWTTKKQPCGGSSKRRNCHGRSISMAKAGRISLLRVMAFSAFLPCGWWTSAAICESPTLGLTLRGALLPCLASRAQASLHPRDRRLHPRALEIARHGRIVLLLGRNYLRPHVNFITLRRVAR